jgi:hypothetical protein
VQMRKRRSLPGNLLLVLVSSAISILVLEYVLGAYRSDIRTYPELFHGQPFMAEKSPYLPFTLPSNLEFDHRTPSFHVVYRFNRYGYRGDFPGQIRKPHCVRRIIVCGDSFTLGWGVEYPSSFCGILQAELGRPGWEVIDAAYHAGYSPDSYYAYLVREGLDLEPDIVVVALFSGNEISDMRDNIWRKTDGRSAPIEIETTRTYTDRHGDFLFSPEQLDSILPWYYRVPVLRRSRVFIGFTQALGTVLGSPGPRYEREGKLRESLPPGVGWDRFRVVTDAINDLCADNGIPAVYVLIPPDPKKTPPGTDPRFERMKSILLEEGCDHLIDLGPVLSGADYFPHDGHFNERGHAKAARAILRCLEEHRLLPATP